jgi:hypothetical protein
MQDNEDEATAWEWLGYALLVGGMVLILAGMVGRL